MRKKPKRCCVAWRGERDVTEPSQDPESGGQSGRQSGVDISRKRGTLKIWAFLSEMTPRPTGWQTNLSKHGSNPVLLQFFNSADREQSDSVSKRLSRDNLKN